MITYVDAGMIASACAWAGLVVGAAWGAIARRCGWAW